MSRRIIDPIACETKITESTVRFVDLASSSSSSEQVLNHGLLSLRTIVAALGDPRRKDPSPQYQGSLLTSLLKDSFGGHALTVLLCCVSDLRSRAAETLETLEFGARAANVMNFPRFHFSAVPLRGGRRDSDLSHHRSASVDHGKFAQVTTSPLSHVSDGSFYAPAPPSSQIVPPHPQIVPQPQFQQQQSFQSPLSLQPHYQHPVVDHQKALYSQSPGTFYPQQQQQFNVINNEHLQPQNLVDPSLLNQHLLQLQFQQLQIQNGNVYPQHLPLISPILSSTPLISPQVYLSNPVLQESSLAEMPVNISSSEVEQDPALLAANSPEGIASKSEEGRLKQQQQQKLASIVEESENDGSKSSSLAALEGQVAISVTKEDLELLQRLGGNNADDEEEVVQKDVEQAHKEPIAKKVETEEEEEDFDSECSDVTSDGEDDDDDGWSSGLGELVDQFKHDTFALVNGFESNYSFHLGGDGLDAPNESLEVGHITAGMPGMGTQPHVNQQIMGLQLMQLSAEKQDLVQRLVWEQTQR